MEQRVTHEVFCHNKTRLAEASARVLAWAHAELAVILANVNKLSTQPDHLDQTLRYELLIELASTT